MSTKSKKKNTSRIDVSLSSNIEVSIKDFINERNTSNSNVGAGESFCEWVLYNIFELREDEVLDATEISGKFDNGLDAIFELNNEICVLQSKYNNAHNIDALQRFIMDCMRLVKEPPITDRQVVKEKCKQLRERYEHNEPINCYYVTNNQLDQWEQLKSTLNNLKSKKENTNFKINVLDFDAILENIEVKKGMLPKEFREKKIQISVGKKIRRG